MRRVFLQPAFGLGKLLGGLGRRKVQEYETIVFSERVMSIDPNDMAKILIRAMQEREAKDDQNEGDHVA